MLADKIISIPTLSYMIRKNFLLTVCLILLVFFSLSLHCGLFFYIYIFCELSHLALCQKKVWEICFAGIKIINSCTLKNKSASKKKTRCFSIFSTPKMLRYFEISPSVSSEWGLPLYIRDLPNKKFFYQTRHPPIL